MTEEYWIDPNAPENLTMQAGYERRSNEAALLPNARLDIAYGPHPRQKLDIFSAGPDAPVIIFFHGGYWRMGSKDSRRFPAIEWNRCGVSWVPVNYRLLPEFNLADAVADARAAIVWLAENAPVLDLDPTRLHVTGNSAGGHLSAMVASEGWGRGARRPEIASMCAVSGLYDLTPLFNSAAFEWLELTAETSRSLSPINLLPPANLPVLVCWGADEPSGFVVQGRAYTEACTANGNDVESKSIPGTSHIGIISDYGTPGTPLFDGLAQLIA